MITDQRMRLLMKELGRNKPLATAGMSERTAWRWRQRGVLPSETAQPSSWRTREDPFADVWLEVEAMLELDAGLEEKLIFEQLQSQYPERFRPGQLKVFADVHWDRGGRDLEGVGAVRRIAQVGSKRGWLGPC